MSDQHFGIYRIILCSRNTKQNIKFSGSVAGTSSIENIGPLSNICYAVFALGSSAYPKFCNFGKTVDKVLEDLGGERLLDLACGDEMYGQEQQFRNWSSNIFQVGVHL